MELERERGHRPASIGAHGNPASGERHRRARDEAEGVEFHRPQTWRLVSVTEVHWTGLQKMHPQDMHPPKTHEGTEDSDYPGVFDVFGG